MFESENTYDLGLLQNAKAHDPEGTVKLLKKKITQDPSPLVYN